MTKKIKSCIQVLQPQLLNVVYDAEGTELAIIKHMNGLDRIRWIKYIKAQGVINSLELLLTMNLNDTQILHVLLGLHIIKWMLLNKTLWNFDIACTFDNLLTLDDSYKTPIITLLIKVYTLAMVPDLSISKN